MTEETSLFLFGDSITFGQLVSPHRTWAVMLSQYLSARLAPRRLLVNNASINGNTTRQALERMPYDIQSHRPDYVMTQFGMNDCNYWKSDEGLPRVSPAAFVANLQEIVRRALQFGARHVVVLTTHPSTREDRFEWADCSYQESNHRYAGLIRETVQQLAKQAPVTLVDIERAFERTLANGTRLQDLLLKDAIHLSERGHELYFEETRRVMEPLLLTT